MRSGNPGTRCAETPKRRSDCHAIAEFRIFPEDLFVGPDELKQVLRDDGSESKTNP
jgi:hypothetical protein